MPSGRSRSRSARSSAPSAWPGSASINSRSPSRDSTCSATGSRGSSPASPASGRGRSNGLSAWREASGLEIVNGYGTSETLVLVLTNAARDPAATRDSHAGHDVHDDGDDACALVPSPGVEVQPLDAQAAAAEGGAHDTQWHVLGGGAMPLDLLEKRVDLWIAATKAG